MKVFEYQTTYRMCIAESEIIKWLSGNIQPLSVEHTVLNALRMEGKARRKRLTTFHRLLMKLARKFYEARAMGLGTSTPKAKPSPSPPKPGPNPKPGPKPSPRPNDDGDKAPKRVFRCYIAEAQSMG